MGNYFLRVLFVILSSTAFAKENTSDLSNSTQVEQTNDLTGTHYYYFQKSQMLSRQFPGQIQTMHTVDSTGASCTVVSEIPLKASTLFSEEPQLAIYKNLSKKINAFKYALDQQEIDANLFNHIFNSNDQIIDEFNLLSQDPYAWTDRTASLKGWGKFEWPKQDLQAAKETYDSITTEYTGEHPGSLAYDADQLKILEILDHFSVVSEVSADGLIEVRKMKSEDEWFLYGNTLIVHYKNSSRKIDTISKYIITEVPIENSSELQSPSAFDQIDSSVVYLDPNTHEIMAIAEFYEDDDLLFQAEHSVERKKLKNRVRCFRRIELIKTHKDSGPNNSKSETQFLITLENRYPKLEEINSWVGNHCNYDIQTYDFDFQKNLSTLPNSIDYFVYFRNLNPNPSMPDLSTSAIEQSSYFYLEFELEKGQIVSNKGTHEQTLLPNSSLTSQKNRFELLYEGDTESNYRDNIPSADFNKLKSIFGFIEKVDLKNQELVEVVDRFTTPFTASKASHTKTKQALVEILKKPNLLQKKVFDRLLLTEEAFLKAVKNTPSIPQIFVHERLIMNYNEPNYLNLGSDPILRSVEIEEFGVTSSFSDLQQTSIFPILLPPRPNNASCIK